MNENDFFSVDKLIEFGIGMTIAQQMVKTMNESINSMEIPGNRIVPRQESIFYAMINNEQCGPLNESELIQLINQKKISNKTFLWSPGMKDWQRADELPFVLKLIALSPPEFKAEQ